MFPSGSGKKTGFSTVNGACFVSKSFEGSNPFIGFYFFICNEYIIRGNTKMSLVRNEEGDVIKIKGQFFEPVKVEGTLYGDKILFNNKNRKVQFFSDYSGTKSIAYKEIEKIELHEVNKKKWWIIAGILCIFVIGVALIFGVIQLPPWKIILHYKDEENNEKDRKKKDPVVIRVRFTNNEPQKFVNFMKEANKPSIELIKLK